MFKQIPQYPMYEISAYGLIRNVKTQRELKTYQKGKYLTVGVYKDGIIKYHNLHRLIALAWTEVPENYEQLQVAHNDGDSMNNHYSNLRWATPKENTHDKYNGWTFNSKHGEGHHNSKLNAELVVELRKEIKYTNTDCMELSLKYGIPKVTIYDAVVGKSWKSVNDKESPADLSGTQYKRKLNANI